MTEIDDVVQGLDKNIEFLKEAEDVSINDIKGLMIDMIGIMRDLWEKFAGVFKASDKLKEIEKPTKEEKYLEKDIDKDQDLKSLYL